MDLAGDDSLIELAKQLGIDDVDLHKITELILRKKPSRTIRRSTSQISTMVYGEYGEIDTGEFLRLALPTRDGGVYEDRGEIGRGGVSEIRRVRDPDLRRDMAMKVMLEHHSLGGSQALARFLEEAQITAQLQHPAIVPVYELGLLPDDRSYFTMEEVRGRTFVEVIDAVHIASQDVWSKTSDGWTLRRLIEVFRRVCEAVAYAHSLGVVHRDIKPENIMVGEFGEVKLMDWGLAKVLADDDLDVPSIISTVRTTETETDALLTQAGVIAGTPSFMAPEQADHTYGAISRRTDVYSLGAVLYYILTNRTHYHGLNTVQVLYRVVSGHPDPLVGRTDGPMLPKPLVAIWERAVQKEPDNRYPDARAIGAAIADWLDGAERHEAAMRAVELAAFERRKARNLQRQARKIRKTGNEDLDRIPPHRTEDEKAPAWALLDEADTLDLDARRHELTMEGHLTAAFAHDSQLPEAHLTMIRLCARRHKAAEARGDEAAARDHMWVVKQHLAALPAEWPGRAVFANYVDGAGQLDLTIDPPGTTVKLSRFELKNRRLVPIFLQELKVSEDIALPMGSYRVEISANGRQTIWYPFEIRRSGTWTGSVVLPETSGFEDGDVFIAAGPFRAGFDRVETEVDSFVIRRHPVTQGEWAEYSSGTESMNPELPVTGVIWEEATLFAIWYSSQRDQDWRLPTALEWEKAARGCDGRTLPWGNLADPVWSHIRGSAAGVGPCPIGEYPYDESPYGIRGMGGNVADWSADRPSSDDRKSRLICGGSWCDEPEDLHMAYRQSSRMDERKAILGFRLVRSV